MVAAAIVPVALAFIRVPLGTQALSVSILTSNAGDGAPTFLTITSVLVIATPFQINLERLLVLAPTSPTLTSTAGVTNTTPTDKIFQPYVASFVALVDPDKKFN